MSLRDMVLRRLRMRPALSFIKSGVHVRRNHGAALVGALALMGVGEAAAADKPTISDFAFVEGAWRSETDGRVFEEIWLAPAARSMAGMGRGYDAASVGLLEYMIVTEEEDAVLMRVRQFNGDLSPQLLEPIVLRLTETATGNLLFRSEDPKGPVRSVRYVLQGDQRLRMDVELVHNGAPVVFSNSFVRMPRRPGSQ